jgi:diguanylate cyclase (GGDEF)-like protein/PAS domain S-box-containing protein
MTPHPVKQRSLVATLALLAAVTVLVVVGVYALVSYQNQKQKIIADMHRGAQASLTRLSENIIPFIEAYAVHEYEKLIETEMALTNYAALVLEDYRMGEILGEPKYVTGLLRNADGELVRFRPDDVSHRRQLAMSYIHDHTDLLEAGDQALGSLSIYMDDAAIRQKLDEVLDDSIKSSLLLAVTMMVLLVLFTRHAIFTPLKRVSAVLARRDAQGLPTGRLPRFQYREITALTDTVNVMLDLIRQSREAAAIERFRLQSVIEGTHVGTWEWNIQTGETVFNERWAEMLGYRLDELAPVSINTWTRFVHEDDLKRSEQLLKRHFRGELPYYRCEARMRHRDGHWIWVLDRGQVTEWTEQGAPLRMYGTHQDISEQKEQEIQLRLAASVFEHVREGIMITDADGTIVEVNAAFSRVTGYHSDEVRGQNPRLLKSGRQGPHFYETMWHALTSEGFWSGEIWNRRKNGEIYPELLTISAVRDAQGKTQSYVALLADISRLKEHERQLEQLAHYDSLTGLPNRLILADRLHKEMARAHRRQEPLGVAFLDLDGFKSVNDRFGHDIGDQLLVVMAERVSHTLRESDTLVRLGGDEFVVLLPDLGTIDSCRPILERILSAVSRPVEVSGHHARLSASIGVTLYPQDDEVDPDQLLRQADRAMYEAKLSGKNRFHLFDAAHDRTLRDQHEQIDRIRKALNNGEFCLHYQPKVNLVSGRVVGAEALIRWQHPEQGLLPPGRFLPMIESDPLMLEVGSWTLAAALEQMERWRQDGLVLKVSVNVAAIEMQMSGFVERLQAALARHPSLAPACLQLEVVETSALENLRQVSQVMQDCLAIGVSFAIDDFGTGYSSLADLKGLPAQELKIDQSFVRDMLHDDADLAILRGVIGLAEAFGKQVIAEGVESEAHCAALVALGCELAQGYGIARPMPAQALPAWIDEYHARVDETVPQ